MPPRATSIPQPLAAGLLAALAANHKIALFLDYDGTLSEITANIFEAHPVAGIPESIARLADCQDRFRVVIISGREIEQLIRLLGVSRGLTFVGNHGLEILEDGAHRWLYADASRWMPSLDTIRAWMRENVPPDGGFLIEDKHLSITLHYRLAEPEVAEAITHRLREFVAIQTPMLKIGEGKMVVEAMPREAGKGAAARALIDRAAQMMVPVYFGDDVTDEDAFYELRDDGVTVKVGEQTGPSWAKYWVASPRIVATSLNEMLTVCESEPAQAR